MCQQVPVLVDRASGGQTLLLIVFKSARAAGEPAPTAAAGARRCAPSFSRTGTPGTSAMEAAARLAGLNANGARVSLPIASPAAWAVLTLERRAVGSQADRPHGNA